MKKILTLALMLSVVCSALAQEGTKRYEIKSGMVKSVMDVMGQSTETTLYFDNYGEQQVTKAKVKVPGYGEIETATILKDGKGWVVNYAMEQVQELPASALGDVNLANPTDEEIKTYHIEEIGTETILGKECTKYRYEASAMGQTAKITAWVYKGIPLKSETSVSGMTITAEAVEFIENAMVLPQTFDVPKF